MSGILAILLYLLAIAVPLFLLYRFGSQAWYWHILAITVALGIGFVPTSPAWKKAELDLIFGFSFVLLLAWGIGGLMLLRRHRARHA